MHIKEPKINYHYKVRYKPVSEFEFKSFNKLVDVTTYEEPILSQFDNLIDKLLEDFSTRQAVILVNSGIKNHNSCLLSLQFQLVDGVFILIANYRSQCELYGRPNDIIMLRYLATKLLEKLRDDLWPKKPYVRIFVNVGNYHRRTDIKK